MRTEQDILKDLESLCTSPGYVHVLANLHFHNNYYPYSPDTPEGALPPPTSQTHLIHTELATLLGLLIKEPYTSEWPTARTLEAYTTETNELLSELHDAVATPAWESLLGKTTSGNPSSPFRHGPSLREAFFYATQSAYNFQYSQFAPLRYANDDQWLRRNKGFTIAEATRVIEAISLIQHQNIAVMSSGLVELPPDHPSYLRAFELSRDETAQVAQVDSATTQAVFEAFRVPSNERNQGFSSIHDYNIINATPIIQHRPNQYLLFDLYILLKSLYESPAYWMASDPAYRDVAMIHRGRFTEDFAASRLATVFGESSVYKNVKLSLSKHTTAAEIDVLAIFGDRAILLQAKSKRLTLNAGRGDFPAIESDFKKGVQAAYDQAITCARLLLTGKCAMLSSESEPVTIERPLKVVYVLCVLSDHYPALSLQVSELLEFEASQTVSAPFVLDIFTLDAIVEMLGSPLKVLSYVDRRTKYSSRFLAAHELTILAYHLQQNLWVTNKIDTVLIDDDVSGVLDVAMMVRRCGGPGNPTPAGVLTRLSASVVAPWLKQIEKSREPEMIELGLFLQSVDGRTLDELDAGVSSLRSLVQEDGRHHDFTIVVGGAELGLCLHCSPEGFRKRFARLHYHCAVRKYASRAEKWFGALISPSDGALEHVVYLQTPWRHDKTMAAHAEEICQGTVVLGQSTRTEAKTIKAGRNDPCPCGSGRKYKKCCLRK